MALESRASAAAPAAVAPEAPQPLAAPPAPVIDVQQAPQTTRTRPAAMLDAFWRLSPLRQALVAGGCVAIVGVPLLVAAVMRRPHAEPAARPAYDPSFAPFPGAEVKGTAGTLAPGEAATSVVVVPTRDALARFRERYMVLDADGVVDFLNAEHAAVMPGGTSVLILDRSDVEVRFMFEFQGTHVVGFTLPLFVKEKPAERHEALSIPTSVPPGTWATIPMPGQGIADTPANRLDYVTKVASPVKGEPAVNKRLALAIMQRVRAKLAQNASIPLAAITVTVGDGAASIIVAEGHVAGLEVRGEPVHMGACSEFLFAASLITADATHENLAKVGVRAVMCKSDGCSAVMDMRPTSPGGGVYGGDTCADTEELLKKQRGQ